MVSRCRIRSWRRACLCRLVVVAVSALHIEVVSKSGSASMAYTPWRVASAFLARQHGRRLELRGGAAGTGLDVGSQDATMQHDGSNAAVQNDREDGAEGSDYTESELEDSLAILERGARGTMPAEPSDMETLRKLEQAVRDSAPAACSQGRSTTRRSEGETGAGALADLLVGGTGAMNPADAVAINQGQLISMPPVLCPTLSMLPLLFMRPLSAEHEEMFGSQNPLRFLSSDPLDQERLTRQLQEVSFPV